MTTEISHGVHLVARCGCGVDLIVGDGHGMDLIGKGDSRVYVIVEGGCEVAL